MAFIEFKSLMVFDIGLRLKFLKVYWYLKIKVVNFYTIYQIRIFVNFFPSYIIIYGVFDPWVLTQGMKIKVIDIV